MRAIERLLNVGTGSVFLWGVVENYVVSKLAEAWLFLTTLADDVRSN